MIFIWFWKSHYIIKTESAFKKCLNFIGIWNKTKENWTIHILADCVNIEKTEFFLSLWSFQQSKDSEGPYNFNRISLRYNRNTCKFSKLYMSLTVSLKFSFYSYFVVCTDKELFDVLKSRNTDLFKFN